MIISVGLYLREKELFDFVEIARRMPEYTFIWFGHTTYVYDPKAVRDLVKENHPENVIFPGISKEMSLRGPILEQICFSFLPMKKQKGSLC